MVGVHKFVLASVVILAGCSTVPRDVLAVQDYVNSRISYQSDQKTYGVSDFPVFFPPSGKGDCEDFALSYCITAMQRGKNAQFKVYRDNDVGYHAICIVDGWAIDVRHKWPIKYTEHAAYSQPKLVYPSQYNVTKGRN